MDKLPIYLNIPIKYTVENKKFILNHRFKI